MLVNTFSEHHPDALADVPGPPDLSVTRAVVQYRQRHELALTQESADEIGVALVMEGRYSASVSAIDLGSGRVKELDLSSELVVLGWVRAETLAHVQRLMEARDRTGEARERSRGGDVGPYCFGLALRILAEVGFSSVTRPSFLRIGFRDVSRDLDPDGGAVRVTMGAAGILRGELDAEGNALMLTGFDCERPVSDALIGDAFSGADVRKVMDAAGNACLGYQVRFPLPHSLSEARSILRSMRVGLSHLLLRFDRERYEVIEQQLETFGVRDTLARLEGTDPSGPAVVTDSQSGSGELLVH